jgi:histidinol-phosphate aminotransferase
MKLPIADNILSISPYKPGKPLEELAREYGVTAAVKLASNENPLGPSPKAVAAVSASLGGLHRYPDGAAFELRTALGAHLGLDPQCIVPGNGSDEVIGMLTAALLRPGDEVILPRPSFLMYEIMTRCADARPVPVALKDLNIDLPAVLERVGPRTRMVFLCNPNNPTGTVIRKKPLERFLDRLPSDVAVVLDEAYMEFVRDPECARGFEYLRDDRPLVVLRTFSKAYGLAGLRIGYGVMPAQLADLLHRVRQPFNVGIPAQAGALAALADSDFLERTVRLVHAGIAELTAGLNRMGVDSFPTQANFFLIDVKRSADAVFEQLLRRGVIVRSMSSYGYPEYIRVNVGLPDENRRLLATLSEVLECGPREDEA